MLSYGFLAGLLTTTAPYTHRGSERWRAQTWRSLFIAPCTPQLNPRACQSCSIAALSPFIAATATYPTAPDISIIYQKAQKGMRHSADIPPWTDTSAVRQPKIMSIRSWRHTFRTSDTY